jgi:hypothetical protein
MYAKANTHNDGVKLAVYLMKGHEAGERAELIDMRGFGFSDLRDGFRDEHIKARDGTRGDAPFFHVYFRSADGEGAKLSRADWLDIADRCDRVLARQMCNQPRAASLHIDRQTGDRHLHLAYSLVVAGDDGKMHIQKLGLYKTKLKELARELERDYGLKIVSNERAPDQKTRAADRAEFEESRRLGTDLKQIRNVIFDCLQHSDNGKALNAALSAHGMVLANGDKRDCFVVVDQEGGHHALNKKLTGITLDEMRDRLSDLDRAALPSVDQAKEQQTRRRPALEADNERRVVDQIFPWAGREVAGKDDGRYDHEDESQRKHDEYEAWTEWKAGQRSPEQARQRHDRPEPANTRGQANRPSDGRARAPQPEIKPLGKTAGEIRLAWRLTTTAAQFAQEIEKRGLILVHVTPEQAKESYRKSAFAKAVGRQSRALREGFAVVDQRGTVTRIDQRTTGDLRAEIDKRLGGIDRAALMNVNDARQVMAERNKTAWLAQQRDERDRQRPASFIEKKIIDCENATRISGATVRQNRAGEIVSGVDALADRLKPENERQTHSATIHGPQAFAARLDQAGIAIVRVTEADVKALDALRSEEELARASAQDVQARKPQHFAKVKAGDIAAVTRAGNVFRLNRHRLDLEGLESAISSRSSSSSKRTAGLPSVTETRARFESEGQKKTALWDQRRVASAERRTSREQSFSRQQTMRGAASATLKAGETVNRSTTRAGKGAGIVGRGIIGALAGLLKLFDIAPAKPPSPEQQKRNAQAAREQQASDDIQARKDATDEQRRQHRKTQEQDSRTAQILGTPPAAHDRQRPREHERDV